MQELCRLPRPRLTQVSTHMQVPQKAQREDGGPRPGLGATGCGGLKAGAPHGHLAGRGWRQVGSGPCSGPSGAAGRRHFITAQRPGCPAAAGALGA